MRQARRPWIMFLLGGLGVAVGFRPQPIEAQPFTLTQITNTIGAGIGGAANFQPSINATGTRIAFVSARDLTLGNPGNADGNSEIFLFDTSTGIFTQITNTTGGFSVLPSINADGTRIAFASDRDLTPGNPGNADGNEEIFLFDTTTNAFTQITNTTGSPVFGGPNEFPSINADGTRIAFVSDRDLAPGSPGNADGNREIFLFTTTTSSFTQITNTTGATLNGVSNSFPSINADGTRIAFVSNRDLTPGNPGNADGNNEIFLFDTTTSTFTQITNTTGDFAFNSGPSINATGTRIAFVSAADLTPGNPGNPGPQQIFLFDSTTGTFTQITNTGGAINFAPAINADGTRIAFANSSFFTTNIFLFDTTTGSLTPITNSTGGGTNEPSINADGARIAFVSNSDLTPGNPGNADGNQEMFLASSNRIPPTEPIPTLSGWTQFAMAGLLVVGGFLALRRRPNWTTRRFT